MRREYQGCGEPPSGHYDAAGLLALHEGGEGARQDGSSLYRFAAVGGLWDVGRRLWPWCPKWWLERTSLAARASADAVQDAKAKIDAGLPVRGLTAEGEALVCWLGRLQRWHDEERVRREAEEK